MGYYLQAFIGSLDDLEKIKKSFRCSAIKNLKQSLGLILLTEELFDEMTQKRSSTHLIGFEYLTINIERSVLNVIKDGTIGYIEADYFGEEGQQAGIVWKDGKKVLEKHEDNVINAVVRFFGGKANENKDEFDTFQFGLIESDRSWDSY